MKKLNLAREVLAELTQDDLRAVAGAAAESQTCTPTYTCINVSNGCLSGGNCFNTVPAIHVDHVGLC